MTPERDCAPTCGKAEARGDAKTLSANITQHGAPAQVVCRCIGCGDPCGTNLVCRKCFWWDCFGTELELGVLGANTGRYARERSPDLDCAVRVLTRRIADLEFRLEAGAQ